MTEKNDSFAIHPSITIGAGSHVHAGRSGAGKSHAINENMFAHARRGVQVFAVDRLREMDNLPPDLAAKAAIHFDPGKLAEALDRGQIQIAICRPKLDNLVDACELAAGWACSAPELRGLAMPEAHRALPNKGKIPDMLTNIIVEWRHHNVVAWFDTQRFARLSADAVELASEVRIFAMSGKLDLKALREMTGDWGLAQAAQEAAKRLDAGEKGWHVHLRAARSGPYVLVRL